MGALPRPDIPPGAQRDLLDALHELHHRAGWPSLRTLARQAGCSHTTVSAVFSSPRLPSWGTLELLVEAMDGDTHLFHGLWLAASTPDGHRPASAARIAGRRDELAAVRHHLETGTGLLLVTGEAGIGKTTLLGRAADTADVVLATGSCLPLSRQVPLLPVVDALRDVMDNDGGAWFKAALGDCPAYVPEAVAPLLPEIGAAPDDGPQDEWGRHRLLNALRSLFTSLAATRRCALALEDLHWSDPSTLELLDYLVRRRTDVAVVGTWRLDDPSTAQVNQDWFNRVVGLADVAILGLAPLTPAETAEQLALLHGAPQPDRLVDEMHARTGGHPLFTHQLTAHGERDGDLPLQLSGLLDARLGDLQGDQWTVARALGVADRPLDSLVLGDVSGLDPPAVTRALHRLTDRRLLAEHPEDRIAALRHPLLADAVRRRLVPGEGADVHRRLARSLAARGLGEPSEIATHWQAAGEDREELTWRIAAARDAERRIAPQQQADHWLRALELWPPVEDPDVGMSLPAAQAAAIEATERSGHEDAGLELALGALRDGTARMTALERYELTFLAAACTWGQRGPEPALDLLDQAVRELGDEPAPDKLARTLPLRANLLAASGRFDAALPHLERATELGTLAHDPGVVSAALGCQIWHRGFAGDLEGALVSATQAREVLDEGWTPWREVGLAMMVTDVLLIHARPVAEVEDAGRRALELIHQFDVRHSQGNLVRANVAQGLVEAGQVAQASELLPADLMIENEYASWPLSMIAARVDLARGRLDDALARLNRPRQKDSFADFAFALPAAEARLWQGEPRAAFTTVQSVLEVVTTRQTGRFAALPFVMAARAAADVVAAGATTEAQSWHARLMSMRHQSLADPLGPGPVPGVRAAATATWEAELARILDSVTVGDWARAATEWDRLARPHDAAYCRWRAAQVALATGQAALATKLLRRAARDAREHVPLLGAIEKTAAGTVRALD